ncbi:MAG TPA: YvcK family protein [Aquificales bacterium]|uniref:Putative gluconeogenesis factor n=1 Tax=Aquifex aeolicus TaxID=63363 RepID=A0A9D0YPY1_AQUAO|nr:YvcK family protein [Aquificales bacterium]HIP98383.1 YvcK family protein [Aquifex aeolicus]
MKVTAIGGGTGLSSLLRALKKLVKEGVITELTAIVTVADSGGSTGRLRKDYNIPAPGDIRNCIVALAETEELLKELFQYRFEDGELRGHAFGNIFLTALTKVTGNFLDSVRYSCRILNTLGDILPSTVENVHLVAEFEDGTVIKGEDKIPKYARKNRKKIQKIWLEPSEVSAPIDTVQAILDADYIIVGPGSFYTSIIPNFLIEDIKEAYRQSRAKKIFVINAMTQPGETDGFTAFDHVRRFVEITGLDYPHMAIVNTRMPYYRLLQKYLREGQEPVVPDVANFAKNDIQVFAEDLIGEDDNFIKHSPSKVAQILKRVFRESAFLNVKT